MSEQEETSSTESAQPETRTRAVCRQCFEFLDTGDNFCRYCGGLTEHGAAQVKIGKLPPPATCGPAVKPPSWLESPVVVLPALFLLIGPLALPMLWRSRRFTRFWKIGLTIAVLLLTVALVWYTVHAVNQALEPLVQELRCAGLQ